MIAAARGIAIGGAAYRQATWVAVVRLVCPDFDLGWVETAAS